MEIFSNDKKNKRGFGWPDARVNLQRILLLLLPLTAAAVFQTTFPVIRSGVIQTSWKWQLVLGLGLLGIALETGLLLIIRRNHQQEIPGWAQAIVKISSSTPWLTGLIWALTATLFPLLTMGPTGPFLKDLTPRLLIFTMLSLFGAGLLMGTRARSRWAVNLAASALAYGFVYKLATFLPDLSTYPLSLGWSEISRYYYGSLFFAEKIYGVSAPPSVLHPSRYILQSLPFLVPDSPLWFHRLWQVFLWISLNLLSAYGFARRLRLSKHLQIALVTLWAFIFLFQGPVLYHLLVIVVIVLYGFDSDRLWRSLGVIVVASIWAGLSRVNWLPMPGFMAATIYFLEKGVEKRPIWKYLTPPVIWVGIGSMIALLTQQFYVVWSGNDPGQFGSSFTSQLFWYRLLPSRTYPLGVLPAALAVSLPILILTFLYLKDRWKDYHVLRLLGIAGMSGVLFTGGVVVSTKIGGGSNLHNLDGYLILSIIFGSFIYFGRLTPDTGGPAASFQTPPALLAAMLFVPLLFTITAGGPYTSPRFDLADVAVQEIIQTAEQLAQEGEEVLFIAERHLLTFGTVRGVSLVPDYERVFLMEMAMSNNEKYLNTFHSDLQNHRFGLIVSAPQFIQYQGRDHIFGEENDAWVRHVSEPVLCYYQPTLTYLDLGVQLFTPQPDVSTCP